MRALAVAIVLAMLATQVHADTTTAKLAFEQGEKLTLQGKWADACPYFEASFRADPQLGALLALAECHEQINRIASAWSELKDALVIATDRNDARKADIELAIKELEPRVPKLKLTPPPRIIPGLTVKRDNNDVTLLVGTEIPTDAGEHEVLTEAPDHEPVRQKVTVKEGAVTTHELPALERATKPVEKTEGILKVKTIATAQIILDSQVVGTGSFEGSVKAGGHTLRVIAGGMRPYQQEVLVAAGETRTVDVPLEPEQRVVIVSGAGPAGPSFELGAGLSTGVKLRGDRPLVAALRIEVALRLGRRVNFGMFGEYASIDTSNACGLDMPGPIPVSELDFGPRNQFTKCTYVMPGLQLYVHIRPGKKLDPYVGVAPGFRFSFIDWNSYTAGNQTGSHSDWLPGIVSSFRAGVNYHPKPGFKAWEVGGFLDASVTFAADEATNSMGEEGVQQYIIFFAGVRTSLQF